MPTQDRSYAFGSALRQALLEARMDQAQLARAVPIDPSQVTRWVNGQCTPSMKNRRRIEEVLKIKLPDTSTIPSREYELFIAAPVGGLNHADVPLHHTDVAKVLDAAREHVNGIYWPSEGDESMPDRAYVAPDIRTEQNLRVLNECPALLYLQFAEVVNPSSAYIELGWALGRKINLTIMVKQGLKLPYMLHRFWAVGSGLRFLPQVRIYTDEIGSADDAAALIAKNGRTLLGLARR